MPAKKQQSSKPAESVAAAGQAANIYQRINLVMQEIAYIQKDSHVQNYMGVSHDQVVAATRKFFVKHGIVIHASQLKGKLHQKGEKYDFKAKQVVPDPMRMYEATYVISFVNIQKPEDRIEITVCSHALDNGDKAPGKAVSYAKKTALLQVLLLETGVDDESRAVEYASPEQRKQIEAAIEAAGAEVGEFCRAVRIGSLEELTADRVEGALGYLKSMAEQKAAKEKEEQASE